MIVTRPEDDSVEALMQNYGMSEASAERWLAILRGEPFDDVFVEGPDASVDVGSGATTQAK